jgi:hypothetical protein
VLCDEPANGTVRVDQARDEDDRAHWG